MSPTPKQSGFLNTISWDGVAAIAGIIGAAVMFGIHERAIRDHDQHLQNHDSELREIHNTESDLAARQSDMAARLDERKGGSRN